MSTRTVKNTRNSTNTDPLSDLANSMLRTVRLSPTEETIKYTYNKKFNCKIYEDVNLYNVIVKNEELELKYYYKISDEEIVLEKKLLQQGSGGKIYELAGKDTKGKMYYLVVKELINAKNDTEIPIINLLEEQSVDCNIIGARVIPKPVKLGRFTITTVRNPKDKIDSSDYLILLDRYNGSLDELFMKEYISVSDKIEIFRQLVNDLYCFIKRGFYYVDIKIENILYKCLPENKYKVSWGDLGSFTSYIGHINKQKTSQLSSTYFPPESADNNKEYTKDNLLKKHIIWTLGLLLVDMLITKPSVKNNERRKLLGILSLPEGSKLPLDLDTDFKNDENPYKYYREFPWPMTKILIEKTVDPKLEYNLFMKELDDISDTYNMNTKLDKYNISPLDLIKKLLEYDMNDRLLLDKNELIKNKKNINSDNLIQILQISQRRFSTRQLEPSSIRTRKKPRKNELSKQTKKKPSRFTIISE